MKWLRMKDIPEDLDDPATTDAFHRAVILRKRFLRAFYDNAYSFFEAHTPASLSGDMLELGSGGGYLKERMPAVITSDIMPLECVDQVVSALDLPFEDESLKAIYMLDVLHHLPDIKTFLNEAARTLVPGGRIILLEPANTCWGRFIFTHFHHEPFEPTAVDWTLPEGGPMSMANGALPWIVFQRDLEEFNRAFPTLRLKQQHFVHPLLYLLSGGVSMKQLLPDCCLPGVQFTEFMLRPFNRWLGLFTQIVVEKKA